MNFPFTGEITELQCQIEKVMKRFVKGGRTLSKNNSRGPIALDVSRPTNAL